MKVNVISKVVENDLCIGCGTCAAVCPQKILSIQWNEYGEYNPVEISSCSKCTKCLQVCPFASEVANEDSIGYKLYGTISEINHQSEVGYYLSTYAGFSDKEHRLRGSSGGIVTWLLERLLYEGIVDSVICVTPNNDSKKLFKYEVFNDPEKVIKTAGSAYYPVEMSDVLNFVISKPGKYAITGLPCFIKAIRLLQIQNKILKDRITLTIGLTCGQLKSKHYTTYIASLSGVNGDLIEVNYRGKSQEHSASNFYFSCINSEGDMGKIFWDDGVSEVWRNSWFTISSCNYCDDIFAECADISCMDAWLPEYAKDSLGTSLVIVRSLEVDKLLKRGNGVNLTDIPMEEIIRSQMGRITKKREDLAFRLYLNQFNGAYNPLKRIKPNNLYNPFKRYQIRILLKMQQLSKELFLNYYSREEKKILLMRNDLQQYLQILSFIGTNLFFYRFPNIFIWYLVRKMRWLNQKRKKSTFYFGW